MDAQNPNSISQMLDVENKLPEDASWKRTFRVWKLDFQYPLFRKLEVGLEKASLDQPSQYFFRAKKCVKTGKNGSFRGGKPPGRNARGNPWGPVRTRGDPRFILGLTSPFTGYFYVVWVNAKQEAAAETNGSS